MQTLFALDPTACVGALRIGNPTICPVPPPPPARPPIPSGPSEYVPYDPIDDSYAYTDAAGNPVIGTREDAARELADRFYATVETAAVFALVSTAEVSASVSTAKVSADVSSAVVSVQVDDE